VHVFNHNDVSTGEADEERIRRELLAEQRLVRSFHAKVRPQRAAARHVGRERCSPQLRDQQREIEEDMRDIQQARPRLRSAPIGLGADRS
jgi:hypothetical protein